MMVLASVLFMKFFLLKVSGIVSGVQAPWQEGDTLFGSKGGFVR
jgi:hypothetical protein